ncbi:hypothetical protein Ahy_B01g056388 [Arachis hypogaea]|uniref:Protein FAR1-RELATED SEQUENCE n=1 Tax=Arachis hypogaea TaxID=3818 RepID=A0A445AYS2_ARAHY|nr:hypothetical protein Ahy_B01g056388 [Arachis hypogaea]
MEYVLTFVNIQHNHAISPSMTKTLRKNRELSLHAKRIAEINDQAGLYEERDRWVLIFLSNSFWVGMRITQMSESMHAFMKGYLTSKSNLQQFVTQYDNRLANKAQQEYELDVASFNTIIPCATASAIEKQFRLC